MTRNFWRAPAGFGLLAAALVVVVLTTDLAPGAAPAVLRRNLSALTIDDGFYYLQIARQVAAGQGSTFDGQHATNGYHPLWLGLLVPVFWLTADADNALLLAAGWQLLFFGLSAALVYAALRRLAPPIVARPAAALWLLLQFIYWMPLSGMEYGLQMALLLAIGYLFLARWPFAQTRTYALFGLLLSLVILARLDTALLALTLGLFFLWHDRHRGWRWRAYLAFGLPILLTGLLYLGLNWLAFASPLPISGFIKYQLSLAGLRQDPIWRQYGWLAAKFVYLFWPLRHQTYLFALPLLGGTLGAAALALLSRFGPVARWLRPATRRKLSRLTPFIAFSLLHYLVYAGLYHGGFSFQPWYFVMPGWLFVLLAALLLDEARQRRPGRLTNYLAYLGAAVLLLIVLLAVANRRQLVRQFEQNEPLYQGAQWAAAATEPDAVIGAWNAGMLAYFSGRTVINLDGLVNSRHYYLVERHDLCRYWRENGVTYLIDVFDSQNEAAILPAYYTAPAAVAACRDQLELVWTGAGYPGTTRFVQAYRLHRPVEP